MTQEEKQLLLKDLSARLSYMDCDKQLDFYCKHHFDYRGLIEKGLAIEAPEDMY